MAVTSLKACSPWLIALHLLICCAPTVEAKQNDDVLENNNSSSAQELTNQALTLADLYKATKNNSDKTKINQIYDQSRKKHQNDSNDITSLKLGLIIHERLYQDILTTYTNKTNKSADIAFNKPINHLGSFEPRNVLDIPVDQFRLIAAEQAEQQRLEKNAAEQAE